MGLKAPLILLAEQIKVTRLYEITVLKYCRGF